MLKHLQECFNMQYVWVSVSLMAGSDEVWFQVVCPSVCLSLVSTISHPLGVRHSLITSLWHHNVLQNWTEEKGRLWADFHGLESEACLNWLMHGGTQLWGQNYSELEKISQKTRSAFTHLQRRRSSPWIPGRAPDLEMLSCWNDGSGVLKLPFMLLKKSTNMSERQFIIHREKPLSFNRKHHHLVKIVQHFVQSLFS